MYNYASFDPGGGGGSITNVDLMRSTTLTRNDIEGYFTCLFVSQTFGASVLLYT